MGRVLRCRTFQHTWITVVAVWSIAMVALILEAL